MALFIRNILIYVQWLLVLSMKPCFLFAKISEWAFSITKLNIFFSTQVVSHCNGRNLRSKMRAAMKNYTHGYSNLINFVSENALKHASDSLKETNCFSTESVQKKNHTFKHENLTEMTEVETLLFCKNGTKLPHWFVSAYRAHRIPHEVADIVTQKYFISPPQVEEKPYPSCYLLVEPIVRSIYTMLWQSSQRDCQQISHSICDSLEMSERCVYNIESKQIFPHSQMLQESWAGNEENDSDVIVEEDSEECQDDEEYRSEYLLKTENAEISSESTETTVKKTCDSELLSDNVEISKSLSLNRRKNREMLTAEEIWKTDIENTASKGSNSDESEILFESIEAGEEVLEAECDTSMKGSLKWYLRKGTRMWTKKVLHVSGTDAKALPSLGRVESMSLSQKRSVFYSVLSNNSQLTSVDLPDDLELILDFIIFWYQNSSSSLLDIHVLSVLVCVFMFYIIDGKVGRIRTRKVFEDEEKWKSQFATIQSDAEYCRPGDGLKDTLAQVSREECLLAAHRLFKFHHMDQKVSDKYYSRKTVHAFSEYQACIYFVQLLNTLLGSPFPLLSVEHLWGGTFCYNIYFDMKKRPKPLFRISELLGKGSCLEKFFYLLFGKLSEILNLKKYLNIVKLVEEGEISQNLGFIDENVKTVNSTREDIPKKKKRKRKRGKKSEKDFCGEREGKDCEDKASSPEEGESSVCPQKNTEMEKEVDLLDNRFAGLLLNMHA